MREKFIRREKREKIEINKEGERQKRKRRKAEEGRVLKRDSTTKERDSESD